MYLKLSVWIGLGLYALLSVTDWVMTYTLLQLHPGAVEANPFAAACLEQYGWNGLALYKVGGVLMFIGPVYLLTRRRPAVAAGVVALGCTVLLSVTVYTHTLICAAHREAVELAQDAAWLKSKTSPQREATDRVVPERCLLVADATGTQPVAQPYAALKP